MEHSLGISNFLEEFFPILLFSSISLHCSLKAFLSLLTLAHYLPYFSFFISLTLELLILLFFTILIFILSCYIKTNSPNTIFTYINPFLNCTHSGTSHLLRSKKIVSRLFNSEFQRFLSWSFHSCILIGFKEG